MTRNVRPQWVETHPACPRAGNLGNVGSWKHAGTHRKCRKETGNTLAETLDEIVESIVRSEGKSTGAVRQLLGVLEYELEAADQSLRYDDPAREYVEGAHLTLRRIRDILPR